MPFSPGGHRGLEREAASGRNAAALLDLRQQRAALAKEAHEVFIDIVTARRRLQAVRGEHAIR